MIQKIFYNAKTTSVARDFEPISLGMMAVLPTGENRIFYAEFTDFNPEKCDDGVKENVIANLGLFGRKFEDGYSWIYRKAYGLLSYGEVQIKSLEMVTQGYCHIIRNNTAEISKALKTWLSQFTEGVEFWADYDVFDKPMLIDLIAEFETKRVPILKMYPQGLGVDGFTEHKVGLLTYLPNVPYYAFYDLHTALKLEGIHPDHSRTTIAQDEIKACDENKTHHALFDARVCYFVYEGVVAGKHLEKIYNFIDAGNKQEAEEECEKVCAKWGTEYARQIRRAKMYIDDFSD